MTKVYLICSCGLMLFFYSCKKDNTVTTKQPVQNDKNKLENWVNGTGQTLSNGTYVFKGPNGQCFQVATSNSGDPVQQNNYSGLANQQWDIWDLGNGYCKITNHSSHLALDVKGNSTAQNTQLIQYAYNGGDNQQWRFAWQGLLYVLINKHSNLVITLNNNSKTQFEKITQTSFKADSAHVWIPQMLALPRISISGKKFVDQNGTEFKLWGVNYVQNPHHSLMEDNWDQPAIMQSIGSDFQYMKFLGCNIVRLQLQYNKYMTGPATPNIPNIQRLLQIVNFAKQNDIHLIVTGLGAFRPADQPAWYTNMTDAQRWSAQANFWTAISTALANNPTIFSYDLMNEPVVNSGNNALTSSNWSADGTNVDSANWFGQYITRQPYPGSTNGINNWETPMHKWIKQLSAAIRAKDATTPITVGMLNLPPFADFTVDLDYTSMHLYPKDAASATANINAWSTGKPLLIEETWPFWFMGMDANALRDYCLANKSLTTGWVSQFFGKTIDQYQNEKPQPLDDFNTMTWFKNFQTIAPVMKTP